MIVKQTRIMLNAERIHSFQWRLRFFRAAIRKRCPSTHVHFTNRKENWHLHNLFKWHVIKLYFPQRTLFSRSHCNSIVMLFIHFCNCYSLAYNIRYALRQNLFTFYAWFESFFYDSIVQFNEYYCECECDAMRRVPENRIWLRKLKDILFLHWHQSLKLPEATFTETFNGIFVQ